MKKFLISGLSGVIVGAVIFSGIIYTGQEKVKETEQIISQLDLDKTGLRNTIGDLQEALKGLRGEYDTTTEQGRKELELAQTRYQRAIEAAQKIGTKNKELSGSLVIANNKITELETKLAQTDHDNSNEIADIQKQLSEAKANADKIGQALKESQDALNNANKQLETAKESDSKNSQTIKDIQSEVNRLENELKKANNDTEGLLNFAKDVATKSVNVAEVRREANEIIARYGIQK